MRNKLPLFALLSALALPAAAHAATFNFTAMGSGGGFSGSGTLVATPGSGGSYTLNSISGPGVTGLVAPNGFFGNDNLIFPSTPTLVDTHGFAFTDTQGNTSFTVDVFSTGVGTYAAHFLDSDNVSATLPVTFSLSDTTTVTPEPSSLMLMGTGVIGLAGFARRRLFS